MSVHGPTVAQPQQWSAGGTVDSVGGSPTQSPRTRVVVQQEQQRPATVATSPTASSTGSGTVSPRSRRRHRVSQHATHESSGSAGSAANPSSGATRTRSLRRNRIASPHHSEPKQNGFMLAGSSTTADSPKAGRQPAIRRKVSKEAKEAGGIVVPKSRSTSPRARADSTSPTSSSSSSQRAAYPKKIAVSKPAGGAPTRSRRRRRATVEAAATPAPAPVRRAASTQDLTGTARSRPPRRSSTKPDLDEKTGEGVKAPYTISVSTAKHNRATPSPSPSPSSSSSSSSTSLSSTSSSSSSLATGTTGSNLSPRSIDGTVVSLHRGATQNTDDDSTGGLASTASTPTRADSIGTGEYDLSSSREFGFGGPRPEQAQKKVKVAVSAVAALWTDRIRRRTRESSKTVANMGEIASAAAAQFEEHEAAGLHRSNEPESARGFLVHAADTETKGNSTNPTSSALQGAKKGKIGKATNLEQIKRRKGKVPARTSKNTSHSRSLTYQTADLADLARDIMKPTEETEFVMPTSDEGGLKNFKMGATKQTGLAPIDKTGGKPLGLHGAADATTAPAATKAPSRHNRRSRNRNTVDLVQGLDIGSKPTVDEMTESKLNGIAAPSPRSRSRRHGRLRSGSSPKSSPTHKDKGGFSAPDPAAGRRPRLSSRERRSKDAPYGDGSKEGKGNRSRSSSSASSRPSSRSSSRPSSSSSTSRPSSKESKRHRKRNSRSRERLLEKQVAEAANITNDAPSNDKSSTATASAATATVSTDPAGEHRSY